MSQKIELKDLVDALPQRELVLLEQFRRAEQAVVDNVLDYNTKAGTKRSVKLEITYEFDAERQLKDAHIASTTKLAPPYPFRVRGLGFNENRGEFFEVKMEQPGLFAEKATPKALAEVADEL